METAKTALILIPDTPNTVDRKGYVRACIEEAMNRGYAPLLSWDHAKSIMKIGFRDYLQKMVPSADEVLIFCDYQDGLPLALQVEEISQIPMPIQYMTIPDADQRFRNTLETILEDVADKTKTTVEDLKRKTRKREIVDARYVYFKRAKELTSKSLSAIGSIVGKDHASVLHGIREANTTKQVSELYNECFD
jgi:hypothetical protein